MAAPDLRLAGVEVVSREGRRLLDVPDFRAPAGQSFAVRGASGAGKSTFLHTLSGLVAPARGEVAWGETVLTALGEAERGAFRRARLGLIFQDFLLFEELSAAGNAGLAAAFAPRPCRRELARRAAGWLDRLGLGAAGDRPVASFSSGERQRVAVARALATEPDVILADEPTASLDRAAADALAADLVRLAREGGRSLVAVTHDPRLAERLDRVITIADGRIVDDINV